MSTFGTGPGGLWWSQGQGHCTYLRTADCSDLARRYQSQTVPQVVAFAIVPVYTTSLLQGRALYDCYDHLHCTAIVRPAIGIHCTVSSGHWGQTVGIHCTVSSGHWGPNAWDPLHCVIRSLGAKCLGSTALCHWGLLGSTALRHQVIGGQMLGIHCTVSLGAFGIHCTASSGHWGPNAWDPLHCVIGGFWDPLHCVIRSLGAKRLGSSSGHWGAIQWGAWIMVVGEHSV
jgi:hypothetical protein